MSDKLYQSKSGTEMIYAWKVSFNLPSADLRPQWLLDAINIGNVFYQGGENPYYTISRNDAKAVAGDWLVKQPNGSIHVSFDGMFQANYREVAHQEEKWHGAHNDCRQLMCQLAKMANMEFAGIKRMVLVLDVHSIPVLHVESFLDREQCKTVQLHPVELAIDKDPVDVLDSTTLHNQEYKTRVAKLQ